MKTNDHILNADGNLGDIVVASDGKITITWPGGSSTEYANEAELIEEIEYEGFMEVVSSELAADFDKIKSKYHEAAKLIREANKVAGKHDISFEEYKYFNICGIDQLFGALGEAGWSTSSMRC